ncbi:amino acid adenylation domain-containing protein [Nocardia callitridis]|uniref:Carrier domain-containing protein n=1 Tax=Nocardia callitridis TaxID=648753 RepID=A0ABP9KG10_9NOCA
MTGATRSKISDILPLTPLQEGLLFVSGLDQNIDVYTVQAAIDISGPLDPARLRAAAAAVLDRHPNLRACFRTRKTGEPVALIPSHVEIPWRAVDLTELDDEATERKWSAILDADRGERFDPATPPLLRLTLAVLGPEQFRLLLTNHHLLLDGWSSPLFVRDLFALYTSEDASGLPAVRPYRDFLRWLHEQDQDRALAAWSAALDDVPGPTFLAPTGATREAVRPRRHTLDLPTDAGRRLGERARELGVTVNSLVSAVWGLVVGRSVDSTDVLFGSTVSGRDPQLDGVESMIGMFLGTVVVRVRQRPDDSLADVVRRVHETSTATMDHQHVGLPAIQRVAGHGELFDTLVVFESYPDSRDALAAVTAGAGLTITSVQPRDSTHYPLTVTVILEPTLTIHLFYHSTAFSPDEIAGFSAAFTQLLALLAEQPTTPLARIDLLCDAERAALTQWSHGRRTPQPARELTELVAAHANSDAIAIRCAGSQWSYAQLEAATAGLSARLCRDGIGQEDRVIVAVPRGFAVAVAILATLRAGATVVPIDLGYPRERIAAILADSAPALILGDLDFDTAAPRITAEEVVTQVSARPVSADTIDPRHPAYLVYTSGSTGRPKGVLGTRGALNRRIEWALTEWDSARLERTTPGSANSRAESTRSGSAQVDTAPPVTARYSQSTAETPDSTPTLNDSTPNAPVRTRVQESEAGPGNDVRAANSRSAAGKSVPPGSADTQTTQPATTERVENAADTPDSASTSNDSIPNAPVQAPARTTRAASTTPESATEPVPDVRLAKSSLAFIDGTTELLAGLAAGAEIVFATDAQQRDTDALGGLISDERVTQLTAVPTLATELLARRTELSARVTTWVLSGEATNEALVRQLRASNPNGLVLNSYGCSEVAGDVSWHEVFGDDIAIGTPVPGTAFEVLDRFLRPVAPGALGELYVRGAQLARGYHGDPATTSARFVAGDDGQRRYATGDLARWRADGALLYIGRVDRQVKIRGNRVEPGEVDAALASTPGVRASATVAVTDAAGAAALRSFVVVDADAPNVPDAGALRRDLAARLPAYLVPAVDIVDQLPRLPGGKIDRRALAERGVVSTTSRAPSTELEHALCRIIAGVLDVEEYGVEDDFFARGGHSLLASRVVLRVQAELKQTLSVRALFDQPTVAELARAMSDENSANTTATQPLPAITRRAHSELVALSPAQRRLWAVEQIVGGSVAYNLAFVLDLYGHLDIDSLTRAFGDVVDRHAALRTLIVPSEDEPVQRVLAPGSEVEFAYETTTLGALAEDVRRLAARPFRLDTELPARGALLRLDEQRHTLVICMHHIAGDEWSTPIIFRDLSAAYRARVLGDTPRRQAESALEYVDYAAWQRELLTADDDPLAAQRQFWATTLDGAPEELGLPFDRPRPERPDFAGAAVDFEISAESARALSEIGSTEGATGFMVVHALVSMLLAKVSGGRDIVLGTPVSGRSSAGVEDIVGLFTNTVALRLDLTGNPDFRAVLRRARSADLAAFDHQDLPFDTVVDLIGQQRAPGRTPLFQTMVQYRKPITAPDFAGLRARVRHPSVRSAKFDLTFDFLEQAAGEGISARIEYSTALFDESSVRGLAERLDRLIDAVTTDPTSTVRSVEVLAPSERALLLDTYNDTHAPVDADLDLPTMVARACREHGDRTALVFGDDEMTYRELDAAVEDLADVLTARGIGADDLVAVALDRSFALLVTVLAIHRAGGAYVPIDREHPAERIRYLLSDTGARLLVADRPLDLDASIDLETLVIDPNGRRFGDVGTAATDRTFNSQHPARAAYVIYTSGSTGLPKGVVVSHAAIVNRLLWMQDQYRVRPGQRVLHKTPIGFDVSVWELFWPLTVGATTVLAEPEGHRDPAYLLELLRRSKVNVAHFVPSMLAAFLAEAATDGRALPELEHVLCSGEALGPAVRDRCHELLGARLHNLYGPTEAAVDVTATPIDASPSTVVPIGTPVWNTQVYVLDRELSPVPVGCYGELYLGGVQLARGYLGRPALTATRFVANPFDTNGSRLYQTGDLVRWNTEGQLEYGGRGDNQVKVRGQRIELGEIEAALDAVDGVRQAAALVHTYAAGTHNIVGYLVAAPGVALHTATVHQQLALTLPTYLIPAVLVVVDELPVTTNGKLDRRALAALTPEPGDTPGDTEPLSERETLVAAAISEVVSVDRLGPDSDFFALGGDSIVALSLIGRLRKRGLELTARAVFERRTVRAMAEAATVAGELADDDTVGAVALTPIVSRLAQREGPSSRLNQTVVLRLPPATDPAHVRSSVAALVSRHDALRLRLQRVEEHVWTLHTRSAAVVDLDDLFHSTELGATNDLTGALNAIADATADRLEPEAGIVARFAHVDRGDTEPGFLVIVAHHLVVDGASWRILLEDLDHARSDDAQPLDAVPVSLRSYAQAITAQAQTPRRMGELAHWRSVLAPGADLVAGELASGTVSQLSHLDIEVGHEVSLATLAPARAIPTTDLLLAALRLAVTRWRADAGVADGDLTVDVERHGRDGLDGLDLTRTVGWLTNVTPVRLPAHTDTETAVLTTAAAMAAAVDGGIGFGMLRYANPRTARILAALPQPQVLFNYLGRVEFTEARDWRPAAESRAVSAAPNPKLSVEYPLEVNVRAESDGSTTLLRARFTFLPKVVRHSEVSTIAELWAEALVDATNLTNTHPTG